MLNFSVKLNSSSPSIFKGVSLGVINMVNELSGVQIGIGNASNAVSGVQLGLFNATASLKGVQIGLFNSETGKGIRPLLNWRF